jgi:hypothetical protein
MLRIGPGLATVAAMGVLVVTACSGGTDSAGPTPSATSPPSASVTPSAAPSVTATPTATPSATTTPQPTSVRAVAYFVRSEKVAAARRTVEAPAVAAGAVRALLLGPTAAERASGMSTAVPAGTRLRSLTISNGTAVVDLTGTFASGGGSLSMSLRLAQVVTTVTQFSSASKVRLWLDGRPATTLGGEGLVVDRPLGRTDVEDMLPAILIETPATGDTIGSPVRVRGSANVFEAVLFLEVTDWDGRIVASRRVMATSGTGTRGTFDVTLRYSVSRSGSGEVIGYSRSPKDGSRINVVETPLVVGP